MGDGTKSNSQPFIIIAFTFWVGMFQKAFFSIKLSLLSNTLFFQFF